MRRIYAREQIRKESKRISDFSGCPNLLEQVCFYRHIGGCLDKPNRHQFGHIGISSRKWQSHSTSSPVLSKVMNSDFIVDPAMQARLEDFQDIASLPRVKTYSLVNFEFLSSTSVTGWAGYVLVQKLKHLKLELKKWNVEVFGNVSSKLKVSEEELHAFDILAEERPLVQAEMARRRVVRGELWKLRRMVEWIWHQKSRLNWTLNGDKHTNFFHVFANTRQNRDMINSIDVNGVSYEDPNRVKFEVNQHFKKQFAEDCAKRPVLGGIFKTIGTDYVSHHLASEFSEAKVLAAIKDCNSNKALGLDGFNLLCYQKFWKVMKPEIMQFFADFHSNSFY
ncbi:uncharacterized protein LOC114257582 [Camellia sinensis]|uniref:uncharacterized protein LOC114257582 n=1 Tax=Camellia sinensis TaxID=4442 RepID=UPI0010358D78|nr:uncharacterized protein LOC114257582 [Camellia sinensis]